MATEMSRAEIVDRTTRLGRRLRNRGLALEVLSIAGGLLLLVAGLIVAGRSSHDASGNPTHPFVALGVGICVAGVLVWAFVWTISQIVSHFADYVAVSQGVDLDAPVRASAPVL